MDNTGTLEYLTLFNALPSLFQKYFGAITTSHTTNPKSLKIIWVSSTDKWQTLAEVRKQDNQTLDFPYLFLKLQSVNVLESKQLPGFLARNLQRFGTPGRFSDSDNTYKLHRFIPADFVAEATFITDNQSDVLRFINKWSYAAVRKQLNFNARFDDITLTITTTLSDSIEVPEKPNEVEAVNFYEMHASFTVSGYLSEDLDEVETKTRINRIGIRPVLYSEQFGNLDEQVASDVSGATTPNYLEIPNTNPVQYEEIQLDLDLDGNATIVSGDT